MRRHAAVTHDINTNTALPSQTKTENGQDVCQCEQFTELCHPSIVGKKAIDDQVQLKKLFQLFRHQLIMIPEAEHI